METGMLCLGLGALCSHTCLQFTVEKVYLFLSHCFVSEAPSLLGFEKGLAVQFCIPKNFVLGCRRAVGSNSCPHTYDLGLA